MGGNTISTSETKIEALQLQSSAYGVTVPLVYGLAQIPGNLVWYGGFKATPQTQSQGGGGKGGGVKTQNTTYAYSASVEMGLCHGVINGIPRVWKGQQQFYGGIPPTQLLTVSESTTAGGAGSTFTTAHAAAWRATVSVVAPTGSGENLDPFSVLAEGVHYTVAAGVYTWLAPAAGLAITVKYQYTTGTVTQSALAQLGLTFISGQIGQAPWSALATLAPTQSIGYSGLALVAGQDYPLGTGAQVDNHLFEIQGPMAYSVSSSTPDADPADIVADALLNPRYGAGLPVERLASMTLWSSYNRAAGLLCSPALTEQVRAADLVTLAARLTNSAPVWSAGRLKFVPYGDSSLTANGRTYTPNVTPLYDLTDDHFLDDETPVDVQSKPPSERYNHIRLEFRNRGTFDGTKQVYTGQYAVEIAEAKDQADIEANGLRSKPIEQMHWICDGAVAQAVAYLLLYRSLFVTNAYVFRLPWTFSLVEPMDLLTLTDAPQQLNKLPVRVTKREEDEEGTLTFTAEDFPLGIATATLYNNPLGTGFAHDYNAIPGPVSAPVIFEAPGALVDGTGLELYVAVAGTGANWAGCTIWVSLDGVTYRQMARLVGGSRYGALTGAIASGSLPVSILAGQLLSGSATDAAQLSTLCYIAGATPEFLAYQTAMLTGALAYALTGLVRGAYNSPSTSAHANADKFARIDDAIAKSGALDLSYIGKTVHIKCTSFNQYGGAEESLASVTDYTYTITGANSKFGRRRIFRAISRGLTDTAGPAFLLGLFDGETSQQLAALGRSYTLARIRRLDNVVTFTRNYDVYGVGGGGAGPFTAADLAADLNATGTDSIVAVIAYDEPQAHRLDSGLDVAMYRCGASHGVFGSPQFKLRSSYILIGIGGCGEGNGYEAYQGSIDNDTNAWCDITFQVQGGNLLVTGAGATPRTLADYSYSGALDATAVDVFQDTHDFAAASLAGAGSGPTVVRSFTITPTVACVMEVTGTMVTDTIDPDSGNSIGWRVTPAGGGAVGLWNAYSGNTSTKQTWPFATSFSAAAGVAQLFELVAARVGGNPAIHGYLSTIRVGQIRRAA